MLKEYIYTVLILYSNSHFYNDAVRLNKLYASSANSYGTCKHSSGTNEAKFDLEHLKLLSQPLILNELHQSHSLRCFNIVPLKVSMLQNSIIRFYCGNVCTSNQRVCFNTQFVTNEILYNIEKVYTSFGYMTY